MQTYGFSRITIQQLDNELKPVAGKKHVIDGKPKEGAAASFEITGLTKNRQKFSDQILHTTWHVKGTEILRQT
ncbi:hypothetical protein [Enterococcus faecalis]|uniref:hypothetical protein n=1 Tax=Enterococcus faecalis TaxID=1351 RepID=UPI0025B0470F|nr:hypothetical protein [Enterococcus faecalis]MDN3194502.1 hypothetical protein [Enterococcus faecalis]